MPPGASRREQQRRQGRGARVLRPGPRERGGSGLPGVDAGKPGPPPSQNPGIGRRPGRRGRKWVRIPRSGGREGGAPRPGSGESERRLRSEGGSGPPIIGGNAPRRAVRRRGIVRGGKREPSARTAGGGGGRPEPWGPESLGPSLGPRLGAGAWGPLAAARCPRPLPLAGSPLAGGSFWRPESGPSRAWNPQALLSAGARPRRQGEGGEPGRERGRGEGRS